MLDMGQARAGSVYRVGQFFYWGACGAAAHATNEAFGQYIDLTMLANSSGDFQSVFAQGDVPQKQQCWFAGPDGFGRGLYRVGRGLLASGAFRQDGLGLVFEFSPGRVGGQYQRTDVAGSLIGLLNGLSHVLAYRGRRSHALDPMGHGARYAFHVACQWGVV